MKEFSTAVALEERKALPEDEQSKYEFKVDGRTLTAYSATPEQVAVVLSQIGRHATITTKIAGIIDFMMAVMDDEDAAWLAERLLDRSDPFGLDDIEGILSWLMEEWSGHPTQGQSDSSSSQSGTGPTSTQAGSETPSLSPSTGS